MVVAERPSGLRLVRGGAEALMGLVWLQVTSKLHKKMNVRMEYQMKSICKIFSGMCVTFRDESSDGN